MDALYRYGLHSIDESDSKVYRLEAAESIKATKVVALDHSAAVQLRCISVPCALHTGPVLRLGMAIFTLHFLRSQVLGVGSATRTQTR